MTSNFYRKAFILAALTTSLSTFSNTNVGIKAKKKITNTQIYSNNSAVYLTKAQHLENKLVHQKDNAIDTCLEVKNILQKNGNRTVENKRWQIIEINGKSIKSTKETHYLIFNSKLGRIEAKANCNVLSLPYSIKNKFQLKTSAGISTLMACQDNLENEFLDVLMLADNITTDGKTLSLNKGRIAPLARFELVK